MRKYAVLIMCLLVSLSSFSQTKKKGVAKPAQKWEAYAKEVKKEVHDQLKNANMPMTTEVMRLKQPAKHIKIDVSTWNDLVLKSLPTSDGDNYDHGVWGGARLIKADGTVTWLNDLKYVHGWTPHGQPGQGTNFAGKKMSVNGQIFDHALLLHSNGELAYKIDKKYKYFEVEVGVEDNADKVASIEFQILNIILTPYGDKLKAKFPQEVAAVEKVLGSSIEHWLVAKDTDTELVSVEKAIKKLDGKANFGSELATVAKIENIIDRSMAYVGLYDKANKIFMAQEDLKWINLEAIKLAIDDMAKMKGFDKAASMQKYKEIEAGYKAAEKGIYTGQQADIDKVNKLKDLKKGILLSNPLLDDAKIMTMRFDLGNKDRSAMADALGMPANNWSSMYSTHRTGVKAEITELSNLRGDVKQRTVYKPKRDINISDLQIHWDGDKLLFTAPNENNKWQIYEINVDGTGLKQKLVVNEPDLEFCDGNYLPDGRIIASTNIGYHGVPCVDGSDQVGNLSLYNPKNGEFRRLTFDQDGNWNPVVMNNGRVMYTRWEYTDLTHYFSRIVMHMNPDGTENKSLYGSDSYWPNSTFDIKPLPNQATSFVGIISGHHGIARSGRLMIFDPSKGREEEKGVVQELPFRNRKIIPEIKDYLVDGVWPQFVRPQPINDDYFLVSAKLNPEGLWGIYLVDVFDNLTCVAEFDGEGLNAPLLVRKEVTPPVIPDRVNLKDKEATVFIQDIYEGAGSKNIPKGEIKELRIFSYDYAYWNSPSDHYAQGIQSGWDIKRLLGVVPVEADGSALFKIPANMPISLQPLDEEGRAVQWFRSWFTAMPGENVSCIGCHEDQNMIVLPKRVQASQIKPHIMVEPEGGQRPFTFDLEVQPILDSKCIACHDGGTEGRPNFVGGRVEKMSNREWSKSYLDFMPYFYRQGPEAEIVTLNPYEYHASNSELVRMLKKGHHNVELSDTDWRTLYNWIDFNVPYNSSFENISLADGRDQYQRRMELMEKYNDIKIDWREEIKEYTKHLKSKGDIAIVTPKEVSAANDKQVNVKNWPFASDKATAMQNASGKKTKMIEVAPGVEMKFVWVPAGEFVMGDNNGEKDTSPAFKASVKKGFWMSESEVSNKQYTTLFPEHSSRYIGQFWKDHVNPGYPAFTPELPVIRVSYQEAMKFCETMASKNGVKITLPTETQWEWACRAGSNDDFWYGSASTDFSKLENMADAKLSDMAVIGMDPQPMRQDHPWRKYWDYIPKDADVNDGSMLAANTGSYQANPWGLKDMHGNVAEWTKSDYVDYPIKNQTSKYKVVRGGSWTDRPKYSSSSYRKPFLPWQKVYNVGFRVIIEE